MEHAFGRTGTFTVGVEEELLLVSPDGGRLADDAERILPAMRVPPAAAAHEAYAAEIELRTPVCRDADEARAALSAGRTAAMEAGATLMGAGVHPLGELGDARLVDAERYRKVRNAMRGIIQRTPECALHVHVGMPDPETAIRVFNGLRAHLPLLAGLSANSPWWFGRDSGLASARAALVRSYPGRGVPRAFRDFEDYLRTVEASTRTGDLDDYTMLWWDVRPHPKLGTVEVREMDVPARLDDTAAIAALVQALAHCEAHRPADAGEPPADAIAWSSFRAARDGLDARILHDGRLEPLAEATRTTVERIRPHARELGSEDALGGIERILREGGGAARQRAAHARGGTAAMVEALLAETRAA
jgi:carboxylate-amine ligase